MEIMVEGGATGAEGEVICPPLDRRLPLGHPLWSGWAARRARAAAQTWPAWASLARARRKVGLGLGQKDRLRLGQYIGYGLHVHLYSSGVHASTPALRSR